MEFNPRAGGNKMKLFGKELTTEQIISFCKIGEIDRRCKDECLLGNATIDLITEIERLQGLNAKYIETIQELKHTSGWIPMAERLPEIVSDDCSENVLIAVKYGTDKAGEKPFICCGYYLEDGWWSYAEHICSKIGDKRNSYYEGDCVTHWMPLPEPPKGE